MFLCLFFCIVRKSIVPWSRSVVHAFFFLHMQGPHTLRCWKRRGGERTRPSSRNKFPRGGKPLPTPRRIGSPETMRWGFPRPVYHIICFLNCVEPHHPAHVLAYAVNDQCHQHFSLFPTFVLLRITLALYRQIIPCSRRYLRGEGGEEGGKERRTLEISDLISMGFYSAKTLVFPSLDKLHFIAFCILVLVKETNECTW